MSEPGALARFRFAVGLVARMAYRGATVESRVLPDFFVLGPPRSGTSSLHAYLRQNRSFEAAVTKELGYEPGSQPLPEEMAARLMHTAPRWILPASLALMHRLYYTHGYTGYRKLFPLRRVMERTASITGAAVTGDFTVLGLYDPDTADGYPFSLTGNQTRYVTILRDPVDFLFSLYTFENRRRQGGAAGKSSFEEYLTDPSRFYRRLGAAPRFEQALLRWKPHFEAMGAPQLNMTLGMGAYVVFVREWERKLGGDRLLVLGFQDLVNDPVAAVARVCRHIGIEPNDLESPEARNTNVYKEGPSAEAKELIRDALSPFDSALEEHLGRALWPGNT